MRRFCFSLALAPLVAITSFTHAQEALRPLVFTPLPLGEVLPAGWLRNQLEIQANGLSGHLDEFWPDIKESGWIGGHAEGWERGPYWLDGVVPLAYLLDAPRLKEKVAFWMDTILANQGEDGWFGPVHGKRGGQPSSNEYDPWSTFIFVKALMQFHEATGDDRVLPGMTRFVRRLEQVLKERPLFEWSEFRWMDGVLGVDWLYERTREPWLLEVAATLHQQGFDWRTHFENFPYQDKIERGQASLASHVVNNAMGIKAPGVWFRHTGAEEDLQAVWSALDVLDRYHGQVTGVFSGDEHVAGKNPSQGTELCSVVEYMFSLETLIGILGDARLADRLEGIAFNALPATFKPDMWAHQYDQQVNQVIACVAKENVYTTNGPDSNVFGLEPNYGCCTSNMHQGWPKFVAHLWMRTADEGLAAVSYAPCTVSTKLKETAVSVSVETDYPFREAVRITVRTDAPVAFPLLLRIPAWCEDATLRIDGEDAAKPPAGSFHRVERTWQGETILQINVPMAVRAERRYNNAIAIHRGPLVYSLRIGEDWRYLKGEIPHADWEVHPTSTWNYALEWDDRDPAASIRFEDRPLGEMPFSPEGTPVVALIKGRRLPSWALHRNAAGPLPESPVTADTPVQTLTLIPYGCTNLRVTEFPTLTAAPD